MISFLFLIFFFNSDLFSYDYSLSFPYISHYGLRSVCDHMYDYGNSNFDPAKVQENDIVFISTEDEDFFIKVHPYISHRYVLVFYAGDHPFPSAMHKKYVDDPKFIAWFAINLHCTNHPKIHPLPLGICWPNFAAGLIGVEECGEIVYEYALHKERNILIYMNFSHPQGMHERQKVLNIFSRYSWCVYERANLSPREYYIRLANSKFVLCPRGWGLDTYRVWESLLMGAIPIVLSSELNQLYKKFPILIVNSWEQINEKFLYEKFIEMQSKYESFNREMLYTSYWGRIFRSL